MRLEEWNEVELAWRERQQTVSIETDENEPQRFNGQIVADDWTLIDWTQCRRCKKTLTPYSEVYYEYYPGEFKVKYGFVNRYCEECAKIKASQRHPAKIHQRIRQIVQDAKGRETYTYEDGSELIEGDYVE